MAFDVKRDRDNIMVDYGTMEGAFIFCTVCHAAIPSEPGVKRELSSNYFFPGSEGYVMLNGHLRAYFVLKKLLKLPEEELFRVIGKETNGGSNTPFVGEVCGRCEVIVDEAIDLHNKILDLQKQVDFLGERLMECRESNDGTLLILPDQHPENTIISTSRSETLKRKRSSKIPARFSEDDDYVPEVKKKTSQSSHVPKTAGPEKRMTKKQIKSYNEDSDESDYVPDDFDEADPSEDDNDDNFVMESDDSLGFETNKEQVDDEYSQEKSETSSEQDTLKIKSRTPNTDGISSSLPLFEFQCSICSKIFCARSQLHCHTKTVHGFEMLYPCPQCPDLKFSRSGLREHRVNVHETEYRCSKCGKQLSCSRALERHLRIVHKMKITHPCPLCDKVFKMKSELTSHRKQEHVIPREILNKLPDRAPENEEERLWAENPCQYCGRVFLSGKTFLQHLREVHQPRKTERQAHQKMKCFFCWKTFSLEQARWIHTRMDHQEIPLEFPCEICTEEDKLVFESTSKLYNHYQTVHQKGDVPIYQCVRCGWSFMKEESYKAHIEVHIMRVPITNPDAPPPKKAHCTFKCWFCWEIYPTENALQKHVSTTRRHRNLKVEFPCDVEQCEHHSQPFEKVGDLNAHLEKYHGHSSLIHHCSVCRWGFISKDLHDIHKLNHVHRRYAHYKCPNCDKSFRKLWSLKDHFNTIHGSDLEIHKCDYCHLRFTNTRSVAKHMGARHHEQIMKGPASSTAMPCDQCGKVFRSEKQVKTHQRKIHGPKICKECGFEFPTNHRLQVHRRTYHKKEGAPDEQHLCPECGKICRDQLSLKRHMVIHGEKKFQCETCDFKTWADSILRIHIQSVHEAKANKEPPPPPKFPCELCDKGYSRKDSLDDHVRVEHTSETWRVWICKKCGKRFKRQHYLDSHVNSKNCTERFGPDIY